MNTLDCIISQCHWSACIHPSIHSSIHSSIRPSIPSHPFFHIQSSLKFMLKGNQYLYKTTKMFVVFKHFFLIQFHFYFILICIHHQINYLLKTTQKYKKCSKNNFCVDFSFFLFCILKLNSEQWTHMKVGLECIANCRFLLIFMYLRDSVARLIF